MTRRLFRAQLVWLSVAVVVGVVLAAAGATLLGPSPAWIVVPPAAVLAAAATIPV